MSMLDRLYSRWNDRQSGRPGPDWGRRGQGINLPVALGVLGLHLAAVLVWQPSHASPQVEVVIKAVLLPTVKPRQEELRPEPVSPKRAVRPQPQSTRAVHNAPAELSDALAEPAAPPQAPAAALAPTDTPRMATVRFAGEAMQVSETEARPSVAPVMRAAALQATRSNGPQSQHAAAAAESTLPASQSAVAVPQATTQRALATGRQAEAVARSSQAAAEVSRSHAESLEATPQAAPKRALNADRQVEAVTRSKQVATEVSQGRAVSLESVPRTGNVPLAQRLAATVSTTTAQANTPRSGVATLTEQAAISAQAMPLEQTAKLAYAAPGRPMPVTSAEGVTESVDYAENNPEFIYPRLALRLSLEGTVLLHVEVLPDGRPGEVRIQQSSGSKVLDMDALHQLSTWRFKPPQRLGRTHATRVTVPVQYRLKE